jgi:hypothetical protein
MEIPVYREESEIREVIAKFENLELALQEFTHARHLTVASWYLCTLTREDALVRMRTGLQRFIAHHSRQGYHETITRFWMELLGEFLRSLPEEMSQVERINRAVEAYGDKEILFRYYSREFVMSDVARRAWVEPDVCSWKSMATT